jgi:hypothetical protein
VGVQGEAHRPAHNFLSIIKIINHRWLILINLEVEVVVEVESVIIVINLDTCQENVLKKKDRLPMEEEEVIEVITIEMTTTEEVIEVIAEIVVIVEIAETDKIEEKEVVTEVVTERKDQTITPIAEEGRTEKRLSKLLKLGINHLQLMLFGQEAVLLIHFPLRTL